MKKLFILSVALVMSNAVLAQQTPNTNKNYVKSTSYQVETQDGLTNANTSSALEVDDALSSITYYDGLGRPEQSIGIRAGAEVNLEASNLLTFDWIQGNYTTPFFIRIGANDENEIITGTTPFGDSDLLWECSNLDDNTVPAERADGGWNTAWYAVDNTVGYRYTIWVKRTGSTTDGNTYHGTKNVNDLDGTPNSNPYFFHSNLPQVDTWYLMVGIIHPHNYTGADTGESGVYDMQGNKVLDGKEYKWDSSTTTSRFRNYMYYSVVSSTKQYFYKPLLERLDGGELPVIDHIENTMAKDIITPIAYDAYGRQTEEYLPLADVTGGNFTANDMVINDALSYYESTYTEDSDGNGGINAYSEKVLESSPLSRVLEQGAPGTDWRVDETSDTDHTIKFEYETNALDEVVYYRVIFPTGNTEEPQLFYDGHYTENELYKTITKDENWQPTQTYLKEHTTEEFKNKSGQVILKRTYIGTAPHDTQYVYDDYGNLTYVLSPKGSDKVLYQSVYPNFSEAYNYSKVIPVNSKGGPIVMGNGTVEVTVDNVAQTIDVNFDFSLDTAHELKTGPIVLLNQSIPDAIIGTLSGTGYSYLVSLQEGYLYLSGSGDVSSISRTLTANLPTQSISVTDLDDLCYQYHYDKRNRLVEKKIPGKGWEYIVYDGLDRPVLTQDANLRKDNDWLFTKYDAFGRVVYTGKHNYIPTTSGDNGGRLDLQSDVNGQSSFSELRVSQLASAGDVSTYHSNGVIPTTNIEVYTINYYDDYPVDITAEVPNINTFSLANKTYTIDSETKSLATGSRVRVLGTSYWITSATYYDDRARPIYVGSKNDYLNTEGHVKSAVDFVGKVLETEVTHTKGTTSITTNEVYTYDHIGRLKTQTQSIDSGTPELIVNNNYDELGQLTTKRVGGAVATEVENSIGLQSIDYTYNIRGWLKEINDINNLGSDLFSFKLNYNSIDNQTGGTGELYNGNISQSIWKTASIDPNTTNTKRGYKYGYDALNRIELATMQKGSFLDEIVTGYHVNTIAYDKNGNILSLKRSDNSNTMDDLQYTYSGNQLTKVDDAVTTYSGEGFKDGNTTGDDYVYDFNGNMVEDKNKGITAIFYNHLNLPTKVEFNNNQNEKIEYFYDATGVKQEKKVTDNANTTYTRYAGNFIYEETGAGEALKFFSHPEGYVQPVTGGYEYVYQYKDHLGNIRLAFSDSNGNQDIDAATEIIVENNYYPFGLEHKGYNNVVSANSNSVASKFKYNSKELEESLGYGMYEYEARHYDPALGRFMTVDPLAEDYNFQSTYAYAMNSPIFFIDKLGMGADWIRETNADGSITYTAEAGDSALTLYQQHGEKDGFTAEEAIDIVEEGVGRKNYTRESDGMLMSNVEVGDSFSIGTVEEVSESEAEISAVSEISPEGIAESNESEVPDFGIIGDITGANAVMQSQAEALDIYEAEGINSYIYFQIGVAHREEFAGRMMGSPSFRGRGSGRRGTTKKSSKGSTAKPATATSAPAASSAPASSSRTVNVRGHYRTLKSGKKIWVKPHTRTIKIKVRF